MVKIPDTGRIGRLARAVEKELGREKMEMVMQGADRCFSTTDYSEKAEWARGAMVRLEKSAGREKSRRIMESCGRKCCGVTSRKRAKECAAKAKDVQELLDNMNRRRLGGGRLKLKDKNTIVGGYDRCYCGLVKQTKEKFQSMAYCQCSTGWYKQLFETALGKPVQVELKRSIICGAKTCEFEIKI